MSSKHSVIPNRILRVLKIWKLECFICHFVDNKRIFNMINYFQRFCTNKDDPLALPSCSSLQEHLLIRQFSEYIVRTSTSPPQQQLYWSTFADFDIIFKNISVYKICMGTKGISLEQKRLFKRWRILCLKPPPAHWENPLVRLYQVKPLWGGCSDTF